MVFEGLGARNFLDRAELADPCELQRLFGLAAEKDTGFAKSLFLEALVAFDRFTPDDFGLNDDEHDGLRKRVLTRRAELSKALRRNPPDRVWNPNGETSRRGLPLLHPVRAKSARGPLATRNAR